jgi:hypothetical protein
MYLIAPVSLALFAALTPPPAGNNAPPSLTPWLPWVLHGKEADRCPFLYRTEDNSILPTCEWPSRLTLDVGPHAGKFHQEWTVFDARGGWVALPGDAKAWPQDVRVDGKPATVTDEKDVPRVRVPSGTHTVTGTYAWRTQPASLQVPEETGLVRLILNGKAVQPPVWNDGALPLQRQLPDKPEEDRLVVGVSRLLEDGVPAVLDTEISLSVSGKSREVTLGPVLPSGLTAISLTSPLPVRLQPDGRLRVQLRSGDWTVQLIARSSGPVGALTEPKPTDAQVLWASEAIWAFSARDALRKVTLSGSPMVDPAQTRLPSAWQGLPAYRLRPGDTLELKETRRGESAPPPSELTLQRQIWLDRDGRAYTVHDAVAGRLADGWRLDVERGVDLGRAAVGGQDQFLTRDGSDGPIGVEVRREAVDIDADARIARQGAAFPAIGWMHDFHSVSETLHLPPGWRLLYASGADEVRGSWVRSWALTEILLALLIVFSVWRLSGVLAAIAAALFLALCHQENAMPAWAWLALIALSALLRAVRAGQPRELLQILRVGAVLVLAWFGVLFVQEQLRLAIAPQLEEQPLGTELAAALNQGGPILLGSQGPIVSPSKKGLAAFAPTTMHKDKVVKFGKKEANAKDRIRQFDSPPVTESGLLNGLNAAIGNSDLDLGGAGKGDARIVPGRTGLSGAAPVAPPPPPSPVYATETDPDAAVQTGPGVPTWTWRQAILSFDGPVQAAHQIRLYLIPPWLERLFAILRVLLGAVVLAALLGWRLGKGGLGLPGRVGAGLTVLLVLSFWTTAPAHAAETHGYPDKGLLDELQKRALEPPDCAPRCVSIQRLRLTATPRLLDLGLEVASAADTAIPLPGAAAQWTPTEVELDGRPAHALSRGENGGLWLQLGKGSHRIRLWGPIADRETVQLALPLKPHAVEVNTEGWSVFGLHDDDDQPLDAALQLTRNGTRAKDSGEALRPGELPPFAQVTRTLALGVLWKVHTEVVRLSPTTSALVLQIPLLRGESVTTGGVHVLAGKVEVNVPPGEERFGWDSVLEQRSPLELKAPTGQPWTESWSVAPSPIWKIDASGVPRISSVDEDGNRRLEWVPWPGESVKIEATRPPGVTGPTLTIVESRLSVTPGPRDTKSELSLKLHSSRGGEHTVLLPIGAVLERLSVDGAPVAPRQDGQRVTFTVRPGEQSVDLVFTQHESSGMHVEAPAVNLGFSSVNAQTEIRLPDRLVLLAGGEGLGPVVLLWPLLLALLLAALVLGRSGLSPLRGWQWFLLLAPFTQQSVSGALIVGGFWLALGVRRRAPIDDWKGFDVVQVGLAVCALLAIRALAIMAYAFLTGSPDMQIAGNGSSAEVLRWYVDRVESLLPRPWVVSVPFWIYRVVALAWVVWLASSLPRWGLWVWDAMHQGGLWKSGRTVRETA